MTAHHRLLYLVGQLGGGGLERQLHYLLSALDRPRYCPAVAVWNYDPNAPYVSRIRALGVPLYPIPRDGGKLYQLGHFRKLVSQIQPEVVHSYSIHTNFPAWLAVQGRPTIAVGSIQSQYWYGRKPLGSVLAALSCRFPATIIVNSRIAMREAQAHRSRTAPRQLEFVPNGTDTRAYRPRPFPDNGRFEMLGLGSLYPVKAWDVLLRAVAQFNQQTTMAWRLRICGDGPEKPKLQELCRTLGIAANVRFPGFQNDVPSLLASAHVFVFSSSSEGTPNVILEAMAAGRPVVTTAAGDIPDLVTDGVEGWVAPVGDAARMAECLQACAENPDGLVQRGQAARRKIEQHYTLEHLVRNTLAAYRRAGWREPE